MLRADIASWSQADSSVPGRMNFRVNVRGAEGPLTYQWSFTGGTPAAATTAQPVAEFPVGGTYAVTVTVSDGVQTTAARGKVTVSFPPVPGEPAARPAPDPYPGSMRNPTDPRQNLELDAAWKARAGSGLIVITHGLWSAATEHWLSDMAGKFQTTLDAACPNIAIWDWEYDAAPVHAWGELEGRYPDLAAQAHGDPVAQGVISLVDAAAEVLAVRFVAPTQGAFLADWIEQQISAGYVDSSAPIHLIGHSAGGFVMGECGLALGTRVPSQQVTMLDTPCPYRSHVKEYQKVGKVERYVTSVLGRLTLDFITRDSHLPGLGDDLSLGCTAVGTVCGLAGGIPGSMACSFVCNRLSRINTGPRYHRSVVHTGFLDELVVVAAHQYAHDWYTESIMPGASNGFAYSPWGTKAFTEAPDRALAGEDAAPEPTPVPLVDFTTFGDVSLSDGVYTVTEGRDAGFFKTIDLPIGTETLSFSYRFAAPGDGDFLSVHWGTNIVLYVGPDLQLTRAKSLSALVPVAELAGLTNRLMFTLVSRGQTNAVLNVADISITVNPDADGDGLDNAHEAELGTNPSRADTDGDGLGDGEEVNVHQTNPSAADADGDGAPDADEVMAGTSPTDPGSVLGVRLVPDGPDGWRLEWPGASNRVYLVNVATELPPSRYTILAEDLPAALPTTVFDLPGATNVTRFYWIEVK